MSSHRDIITTDAGGIDVAAKFRDHLDGEAQKQRKRGVPYNTERAYRSDWEQFKAWCDRIGYPSLPTTEKALCSFLTHLSLDTKVRKRKKRGHRGEVVEGFAYQPVSIERKLAAIVKEHKKARHPSPRTEEVSAQLHAIWVDRDTKPQGAAPLLGAHLKTITARMVEVISEGGELRDVTVRDRSALLIGWHCALRRSEVAGLKLSSVEFLGKGVTVHIGRSKTDQEGKGRTLYVNPSRSNPDACPVAALQDWLKVRGEKPGALFWHADWETLSPDTPMPAWQMTTVIDRWVRLANIKPESKDTDFSPHSLRAGFITHAMRKGLRSEDVMDHSGHASYRAFQRYVKVAKGFDVTVQKDILEDDDAETK
jgi:integrase